MCVIMMPDDHCSPGRVVDLGQRLQRSLNPNRGLHAQILRALMAHDADAASSPHAPQYTLARKHAELGNQWSRISGHLQGRTDNATKNHFVSCLERRRWEEAGGERLSVPHANKPAHDCNVYNISLEADER
jgi:hypothetical protein